MEHLLYVKSLPPTISLRKYCWVLTLGILSCLQGFSQASPFDQYKQETYEALEIINQDSLDEETRFWVDTMLQAFQSPTDDTTLFLLINIALTGVNVSKYSFPLEVGDLVDKMYVEKWKENLSAEERDFLALEHLQLLNNKAQILIILNRQYEAFEVFYDALTLAEMYKDTSMISFLFMELGIHQFNLDEYEKAQKSWEQSLKVNLEQVQPDTSMLASLYRLLPYTYLEQKKYEAARATAEKALNLAQNQDNPVFVAFALESLMNVSKELEDWYGVIDDGKKALEAYKTAKIDLMTGSVLVTIFQAALKLGQEEEVNRAYQGMLELSQKDDRLIYQRNLQEAKYELAQRKGQYAQALTFYQSYIILRDSIKDEKNLRALLDQQYKYEYIQKAFQDSVAIEQQNALDQLKLENQVQTRNIGLVGSLLLALGVGWIAWVQYQSRRQKQQLADEIQAKNKELVRTQDQLILQEKMASLGQMATGIAHEIKNPLNFIKNFAEGTTDLTEELSEEITPHLTAFSEEKQEMVKELLGLIDKHAGIIQEQGARADAIVVRMMSHASNKRREKTATAINPLIEDSLLLAYHGFKPQNEGLDIRIEKQFDVIFSPIVLHAQDIGRVIINLINNACYALDQKATAAGSDFQPILRITSHKSEKFVSVRIWDNGVGIAPEVKDQIFQPFFTTKPRGEGNVGLGLSISYDIVTEGHQGTLTVKSEEGKYTQFKIQLPIIEG